MMKKVLIIEDNEQNMYLFSFLLEQNGHRVVQAENGHKGMALAKEEKPDFILLDIQLPDMNGYEIAQKLRKNPETEDIPIIAVTSYAMVGDREKTIESGCTGYIEKPINPDTFLSEINRFIANTGPGGQS